MKRYHEEQQELISAISRRDWKAYKNAILNLVDGEKFQWSKIRIKSIPGLYRLMIIKRLKTIKGLPFAVTVDIAKHMTPTYNDMRWAYSSKCHKAVRKDVDSALRRLSSLATIDHDCNDYEEARLFKELYIFVESLVSYEARGRYHFVSEMIKWSSIDTNVIEGLMNIAEIFADKCLYRDTPRQFPKRKMCICFFILCKYFNKVKCGH